MSRPVSHDPNRLFTLRVRVAPYNWKTKTSTPSTVVIHAFDGGYDGRSHTRIDVEVRRNGAVIFPRGATWCGVPGHVTRDGTEARELVLSLVAMKPGDTDADYFASYTPEQLAFAATYGEELSMARADRYCDENGNVRRTAR